VKEHDGERGRQEHGLQGRPKTLGRPLPQCSKNDKRWAQRQVRSSKKAGHEAETEGRRIALQVHQVRPPEVVRREADDERSQHELHNTLVNLDEYIDAQRHAQHGRQG
jgi:hypothetical protein